MIDTMDAAGLALFCVTGAATALAHRLGTAEAVILGAVTGIGGGMVRDLLIGEIAAELLRSRPSPCGATGFEPAAQRIAQLLRPS